MFHKLMYPAVWFMNHVANWILGLIGVEVATESEEAQKKQINNDKFVDLDIDIDAPNVNIIPDSSCAIIKNILKTKMIKYK